MSRTACSQLGYPFRPNPIGLSIIRRLARCAAVLDFVPEGEPDWDLSLGRAIERLKMLGD